MMSRNILILVTNTYPYGHGESFIETEIDYLSEIFEQVIILPFRKSSQIRSLPTNARVENILTEKNRIYIFFIFFIRTLCSKEFKDELKILRTDKKIINFIRLLLFYCKSLYIESSIRSFVDGKNLKYRNIIFYTYWLTSAAFGLSLLKNKYPLIKLVSRAHGYDLYSERYFTGYIPMQLKSITGLDKLFLISNDGYQYLSDKYADTGHNLFNKMMVSRLGVKNFVKNESPVKVKKDPNLPFLIVTCSSLIHVKRIDLLIKALSILDTKCKNKKIEWHHIGGGKGQKSIEKMAKKKLYQPVSYQFHGVLTNKQVLEIYKNLWVDLFINVSDSEGIPVSIMEAFSFGIPVVARDVGGISEIVNHKNGLLLDTVISPEQLAEILLKIINSKDELLMKRQFALDTWKTKFNADLNYKKFVSYLVNL